MKKEIMMWNNDVYNTLVCRAQRKKNKDNKNRSKNKKVQIKDGYR